jgi:hypothetical protein
MVSTRASTIVLLSAALAAGPALAGVVYEIEVTDHEQSPPKTASIEMAAAGKNLKMEILPGESGRGKGEMIFRGDRREMVVVDEDDKSYYVMDEATMRQLAGQVAGVMGQMQEALKNVPESERRKIEEMMKQRMPQQQAPSRPTSELRKTGERGTHNGYPCVKYEVYRDGRKIREMWVTDWDNIEGGRDVVGAFEEMADFFKELTDSIPDFGQGGDVGDPMFEHMRELGGFPVVTREFGDDGALEDESSLRSARRRTLDPAEFEPPAGYKRRTMLGGS